MPWSLEISFPLFESICLLGTLTCTPPAAVLASFSLAVYYTDHNFFYRWLTQGYGFVKSETYFTSLEEKKLLCMYLPLRSLMCLQNR